MFFYKKTQKYKNTKMQIYKKHNLARQHILQKWSGKVSDSTHDSVTAAVRLTPIDNTITIIIISSSLLSFVLIIINSTISISAQ